MALVAWEKRADPNFRTDLDRLIRNLDSSGFEWDGKHVVARAPALATDLSHLRALGIEDVRIEIERITASVDADPADAITASRSLVETVCKTVLEELGDEVVEREELPALYKRTALALRIDPTQYEVVYRQILQGLISAVQGLAELRNKLGDAHGRGRVAQRPSPRHARMAAGAAATVATFLMETLHERRVAGHSDDGAPAQANQSGDTVR